MKKILSICIPTYNRNQELSKLTQDFLMPALNIYNEQIEIIICDNSDFEISRANKNTLDSRIIYQKNNINLGFSGNLIRCFNEAKSTFIWVISDNDPILWNGFEELMDYLTKTNADNIDCIMLPFQTINHFGDLIYSNRQEDWSTKQGANITDLLNTGQMPFILFSSAVLRLNKSILSELETKFSNNDYLQVILYLATLGKYAKVRFINNIVIDYQPEYFARYSISEIAKSMTIVRKYVHNEFGIINYERVDYRGWLTWLLHHRGGLYQFHNGDIDRWKMLKNLPDNVNIKNLLLAFALVLPKFFICPIYLIYCSYKDMQRLKKRSFNEFKRVIFFNKKFIDKNKLTTKNKLNLTS